MGALAIRALIACTAACTARTELFRPSPSEDITVAPVYPLHAHWGTYVASSDAGRDANHQPDTSCTVVGPGGIHACVHAAEHLRAKIHGRTSCDGIEISDDLAMWSWDCVPTEDGLDLFAVAPVGGHSLRDLIDSDARGFRPNALSVIDIPTGVLLARSARTSWWPNPVMPLPATEATPTILDVAHAIYALSETASTAGYTIDADGIAIVSLGGSALGYAGTTANCDGAKAIVCSRGHDALWLEVDTRTAVADAVDTHISITDSSLSLVQNSTHAINAGTRPLLSCTNCRASLLKNIALSGASQIGLLLDGSTYNTLQRITVDGANSDGISFANGSSYNSVRDIDIGSAGLGSGGGLNLIGPVTSHNELVGIRVFNSGVGVRIGEGAYDNRLVSYSVHRQLTAADRACIIINGPRNKLLSGIVSNCAGWGIRVQNWASGDAFDTTIVGLVAVGSDTNAVYLQEQSSRATLLNLTTALSIEGVSLLSTDDTLIANVLAVGNRDAGVHGIGDTTLGDLVRNRFRDLMVLDNNPTGAPSRQVTMYIPTVDAGADNRFDGALWLSGASGACSARTGVSGHGIINDSCSDTGLDDSATYTGELSTATLHTNIDSEGIFVGPVASDTSSVVDVAGRVAAAAIGGGAWARFENAFRAWGITPTGVALADSSGVCASGDCQIWDWRLRASDTVARNRYADASGNFDCSALAAEVDDSQHLPFESGIVAVEHVGDGVGDDDGICESSEVCFNRFVVHATEMVGDAVGDDDGLCESGERCLVGPNVGAYQGEGGALPVSCGDSGGAVRGVTLFRYAINGGQ